MADDGWEDVTDPSEMRKVLGVDGMRQAMGDGRSASGAGIGVQDNKALNEMRPAHNSALSVNRDYRNVATILDRSGMTPNKAAWLETITPRENGGLFDKLGGTIGSGLMGLGLVDPRTVEDFQTLRGLASKRVMDAQVAQKGPQTEADAARLQLAEVSPFQSKGANKNIMLNGMADAVLAKRKLPFMQQWANKYGLNGTDPQGRTADQVWGKIADTVYAKNNELMKQKRAAPKAAVTNSGAPKVGEVRKGYRYKGGNPAQRSSWEKAS